MPIKKYVTIKDPAKLELTGLPFRQGQAGLSPPFYLYTLKEGFQRCMEMSLMGARTNIVLDEGLVEEIKGLTSLKTKREVVDLALRELLKQLKRKRLLEMRHEGLWEGNFARHT